MAKKTSPTSEHIPGFASIKEEAVFWDTHSTADYEAEFAPVRVRFAKRLSSGVVSGHCRYATAIRGQVMPHAKGEPRSLRCCTAPCGDG
jgi:hypothetical protein